MEDRNERNPNERNPKMLKPTEDTEFESMLNSAKAMMKTMNDLNRPYMDDKIMKFAKDAMSEYREVRDFLVKKIGENIPLWLNPENLELSDDYYCIEREKEYSTKIYFIEGNFFEIYFAFTDISTVKRLGSRSFYLQRGGDEIEVLDVACYPKGAKLYETLAFKNDNTDLSKPRTSREWEAVYWKAMHTREYTESLWKYAKNALKMRIGTIKHKAQLAEDSKNANSKVGNYKKCVSF